MLEVRQGKGATLVVEYDAYSADVRIGFGVACVVVKAWDLGSLINRLEGIVEQRRQDREDREFDDSTA